MANIKISNLHPANSESYLSDLNEPEMVIKGGIFPDGTVIILIPEGPGSIILL